MSEEKGIICCKCNVELMTAKIHFKYLDHSFYADMLKCPKCGQVFIPEDVVRGRMTEVETQLEDK